MLIKEDIQRPLIRFKHRALAELRSTLLGAEQRESFAVLMAKREIIGKTEVFTVHDTRHPTLHDYEERKRAYLRMRKSFIHQCLTEVVKRLDVDTLIEVHTHPFATDQVFFSNIDDQDERRYSKWLNNNFENLHYLSIVFSQKRYQARIWRHDGEMDLPVSATIKTQTVGERIPGSNEKPGLEASQEERLLNHVDSIFNRGSLALGLETMRGIMLDQTITLVGVGGIGSVVAEHLVQMGFQRITLIDPDRLEVSNLNRFVGATFAQAQAGYHKVEAVAEHLRKLNPDVHVLVCADGVESEMAHEFLANSDWIIVSTDNHYSRWTAQQIALRYFIPIIAAGVNITVKDNQVEDMSGEVITARSGDSWCLNCLGRINLARIAAESHPDHAIRSQTLQRGYVTGMEMKEPAVKTLNTMIATMAVDRLVDQFLPNRPDIPILVYEHNQVSAIYEDRTSLEQRALSCSYCSI